MLKYPKISEAKKGNKNPAYGTHHSEEWKRKMSERLKGNKYTLGYHHTEETKKKIGDTLRGRFLSLETRRKLSESKKGKKHGSPSEETLQKRSESMKGHIVSKETRLKISKKLMGHLHAESTRKKISETLKNVYEIKENHPRWMGGKSFEPYCPLFNKEFKERVRAFFGYTCVKCGNPQNGEKLIVHHVNYIKSTCCDSELPLFVSICRSCHGETNAKREYWRNYFTELINGFYQGKCYLSKEEMMQLASG